MFERPTCNGWVVTLASVNNRDERTLVATTPELLEQ